MNLFYRIKKLNKNEELAKIRKFIRKPALYTFIIAGSITAIGIIILLVTGKMENLIVSMNIRYNSPAFVWLCIAFLCVQLCSLGYGIFLSLRKYKRQGGKGIIHTTYSNGTSYRALRKVLTDSHEKLAK